jgi:hypothetical protein
MEIVLDFLVIAICVAGFKFTTTIPAPPPKSEERFRYKVPPANGLN